MFQEWGFLLGEIWILLLLAALLGLFVGWLIWGRMSVTADQGGSDALMAQQKSLQAELDSCRHARADLQGQLDACEARCSALAEVAIADSEVKPAALAAPRNGQPDDLKQIKGIGVKLEQLCHSLGFYHFDQIAGWSKGEIAWVDENLEGFKGRVTRDEWVSQAQILAAGGTTDFAKKVEGGKVGY